MGFFDKIKKLVGKTGVKLEYVWIESPFPFNDPMIKATLKVTAESPITVIGTTGTFVARLEIDGEEEEIILGEAEEDVDDCANVTRNGESVKEFPDAIPAGGESSYGFFVDDLDLKESLSKWGVHDAESARNKGIKFFFIGEVDVKETAGMFDPSLEHQITVK